MRFTHKRVEPLAGHAQLVNVVGVAILLAILVVPLTEILGAQRGSPIHDLQRQQQPIQLLAAAVDSEQVAGGGTDSQEQQQQQAQELAALQERLRQLERAKDAAELRAKEGEQRDQELAALRAQVAALEAAKAAAQQPFSSRSSSAALPAETCSRPAPPVDEKKLAFEDPNFGWNCKLLRDACLDQGRVLVHSGVKTPEHPDFKDEVFKLETIPPPIVLAGHAEPSGKAHYMPVSSFQLDIRAPSSLDPPDVRTPAAFNNCTVPLVFAPFFFTIFADFIMWKLGSLVRMAKDRVYEREWVQFVVDSNGMDLPPFYSTLLRPFSKHEPISLAAISSRERASDGQSRCFSQLVLCDVKFYGQVKVTTREVMKWYKEQYPQKFVLPTDDKVFRVTLLGREGKFRQIINQGEVLEQCKRWQLPPGSNFTHVECSTLSDFSPQNFPNIMAHVERTNALVGVHGSGLGYGYFLPKGSAMVEIMCSNFCGQWPDQYFKHQIEGDSSQETGYLRLTADKEHCSPGPWQREKKGSSTAWARDQDIKVEFPALAQALSKIALGQVWGTDFATERSFRMNKSEPCP